MSDIHDHAEAVISLANKANMPLALGDQIKAHAEHIKRLAPKHQERISLQNRLMWRWNNDCAKHLGTNPNWQHGEWKHDVLLPLMKGWKDTHERAMNIQYVLDELSSRRLAVFASFDLIRSRELSLEQFTEALNAYQLHYAQQGINLTSRDDVLITTQELP